MIQEAIAQLLDGRDARRERGARRRWTRSWPARRRRPRSAGFLVALRVKGETADEIAGCAEAMREHVVPVTPSADRPRRHRRHGRRRRAHAQHLDRGGARRGRRRRGRREARQPRRLVGIRLGGRARGARLRARAAARADRALDRRARLRLHLRAGAPSRLPPRGAGPARARDANGLQRARAADQPGRCARADRRRLRGGARADDRRRARRLGAQRAFVVHGAGGHRRAVAGRAEPRLRGVDGRGSHADDRPARPGHRPLRAGRPARRHAGGERRRRSARSSRASRAEPRRDPPERGRARSPRPGMPATSRRASRWRTEAVDSGAAAERLEELVAFSRARRPPDGTVPRRAGRTRARRDRRDQAPLALGRRPAARRRPGAACGGVRARPAQPPSRFSSTSASAARSTTCAPRGRRPRCLCSPRGSSRRRTSWPSSARRAPMPSSCCSATWTTTRPRRLQARARELGMDALVEAHDAGELERAVALGADPIGMNARDLDDVRHRPRAQLELVAAAPRDRDRSSPRAASTRAPRARRRSSRARTRSSSARRSCARTDPGAPRWRSSSRGHS